MAKERELHEKKKGPDALAAGFSAQAERAARLSAEAERLSVGAKGSSEKNQFMLMKANLSALADRCAWLAKECERGNVEPKEAREGLKNIKEGTDYYERAIRIAEEAHAGKTYRKVQA